MQLQNSTILITGGTSGIGLEFVKQLSHAGAADIIITGRDNAKLQQVKKQFPDVHIFQSDVSQPKDIERLYKDVTRQFPKLNILINNAGNMRDLRLYRFPHRPFIVQQKLVFMPTHRYCGCNLKRQV